MNGLLFFTFLHIVFLRLSRALRGTNNLAPRLAAVERALLTRDYGLKCLSPGPPGSISAFLDLCVRQRMSRGLLSMSELNSLRELVAAALEKQALSERFFGLITMHGGLCLGLGLLLHLWLKQSFWFSLLDPLSFCAIMIYLLALAGLLVLVPWPRPLQDEGWLRTFVALWFRLEDLEDSDLELRALARFEQESGHCQSEERQKVLIRRWRNEVDRVEGRLRSLEDWLGVWELGLASLLALLLWLPALLDRLPSELP